MFILNMVDYPVLFPMLSTMTLDTFLTVRDTWGFYQNHVLPPRPSKSYRVVGGVGGWGGWGGGGVAHKILVSAPVPLELILTGFDWVGAGPGGLGFGTGLDNFDH